MKILNVNEIIYTTRSNTIGYLKEKDTFFKSLLNNPNDHILVVENNGDIISSCTCIIIPNLTHNQRPYAFIENVITDVNYRHLGYASQCLNYAYHIALKENCYKMMLMTGSKKESTLHFYEKNGYNRHDKTAFIRWIE